MIHVCYSPRYYAHTHTNSMEKLAAVAEVLAQKSYIELVEPELIDVQLLKKLHDPHYVDAFVQGKNRLPVLKALNSGMNNCVTRY